MRQRPYAVSSTKVDVTLLRCLALCPDEHLELEAGGVAQKPLLGSFILVDIATCGDTALARATYPPSGLTSIKPAASCRNSWITAEPFALTSTGLARLHVLTPECL
jgi:hypothetical protein